MNLNQSAHGDREYGHIGAGCDPERKVVVGHWEDRRSGRLAAWMRTAAAGHERRLEGGPLWRQHAASGGHRRG